MITDRTELTQDTTENMDITPMHTMGLMDTTNMEKLTSMVLIMEVNTATSLDPTDIMDMMQPNLTLLFTDITMDITDMNHTTTQVNTLHTLPTRDMDMFLMLHLK